MNEPSITIRASAWGGLFDCAYRFEGIHLLGMRNIVGLRAALGTAIHAGTAAFDQSRIDGRGVTVDDAAGVLVDKLRDPETRFDPDRDDLSMPEAERVGLSLLVKYCREVSPRYHFVAVEMETMPLDIDHGDGVIVRLTGTMDRARHAGSHRWARHRRRQKRRCRCRRRRWPTLKDTVLQLGAYELLYEHTHRRSRSPTDAEIIGLKTIGHAGDRQPVPIRNAKRVMLGTDERPGLIEFAARMFRSGDFYPNSRSLLCSPKYCPRHGTCHFHE